MIITIDGPVASGKSTVAKSLAKELGFHYLNTGLLYRAIAYMLMQKLHITEITDAYMNRVTMADLVGLDEFTLTYAHGALHVALHGKDLTTELAQHVYAKPSSMVSSNQLVREKLLAVQRDIAKRYDIIADGRDCGTVVFPHADIKFFLTASPETRARRLLNDPTRKTSGTTLEAIKYDLMQRDDRDKNRTIAPLCVPEDAVVIDNSVHTFEQTVAMMLADVRRKISNDL